MLAELDLLAGERGRRGAERSARRRDLHASSRTSASAPPASSSSAASPSPGSRTRTAAQLFGAAEALRGDSPLERAELTVLERFEPELESALGVGKLADLKARGGDLDDDGG